MNHTDPNRGDDGQLMAQAKAYAAVLRRAAIDDFWRGVGSAARRALHGVARIGPRGPSRSSLVARPRFEHECERCRQRAFK